MTPEAPLATCALQYVANPNTGTGADRRQQGWLPHGDLGTVTSDSYFRISDRRKDMITSGGEWISSVDLENHLMAHPDVAEASVIAVPDRRCGERSLAALGLRGHLDIPADQFRDFSAERIANWQVPEHRDYVAAVPKTSAGKFDKAALRHLHHDGQLKVVTTR